LKNMNAILDIKIAVQYFYYVWLKHWHSVNVF